MLTSTAKIYAVEYHLAPEWRYPVQLDEYSAVMTPCNRTLAHPAAPILAEYWVVEIRPVET